MAKVRDIELEVWLNAAAEARVRAIAREEIASLAGLVTRRAQDVGDPELARTIGEIFGEALRDFSSDSAEPGQAAEV
jgi:hypothetical protein